VAYRGQQFTFEVTRFLDQGGMGQVYEGTRQDDPTVRVAIKVPFPRHTSTFLREAVAAQRVAGPHVVPVVDWGDGPPFIAFQFIAGSTLRTVLVDRRARNEYWSEADLVGLFHQLVDAMQAINAHVVHRDLKPENAFDDAGVLRVSDFGLSKYAGDVTRADTHKGHGTFEYMAPEAWAFQNGQPDDAIDWRADQYSLGVMFYEMATLQRPFAGAEPDLKAGHLYKRPARVTDIVPSLSDRLASLIARMLEKQASKRCGSWDEIARELDAIEQQREAAPQDDFAAGVVRQAAAQIEQMRGRTLEQQRQENERQQKAQQRLNLLDYWATQISDHLREWTESVNQRLGDTTLFFEIVTPTGPVRRCRVTFANTEAQLAVELATLEPERPTEEVPLRWGGFRQPPDDVLAWGIIELNTPRRREAANVILVETPHPYGAWREAILNPPLGARLAHAPRVFDDEEGKGRRYRVVVKDPFQNPFSQAEVVVATNWQALLFWHPKFAPPYKRHNTTLNVSFTEGPLEFERRLDELIEALVTNAGG